MYKKVFKSLLFAFCGVMTASVALTSCQLDEPVVPVEELYLRGFIKQYGLIDPTHDFAAVQQSTVTVNVPGHADHINVYGKVGDDFYRVASYADIDGSVTIPLDLSETTDILMVDVDDVCYYTVPGGTVDVLSSEVKARSRALSDNLDINQLWVNPAQWSTVTATNGQSGVAQDPRKKIVINNDGTMQMEGASSTTSWIDVTQCAWVGTNFGNNTTRYVQLGSEASVTDYEIGNTSQGANVRFLIDNQKDEMSSFTFKFRTACKNGAVVRVIILGLDEASSDRVKPEGRDGVHTFLDKNFVIKEGNKFYTSTGSNYDLYPGATQWEVNTGMMPKGKYELILLGWDATKNADGQDYCGNWGFFEFEPRVAMSDMAWIMACEDLGTTDDFDFNDIIIRIESVNTNTAALALGVNQWQVIEDDEINFDLHPARSAASRIGNSSSDVVTHLRVEALAAGGILPVWLHFRDPGTGTDYIVAPDVDDPLKSSDTEDTNESYEWHKWFDKNAQPIDDERLMYNTGYNGHKNTTPVEFVATGFSLKNYSYIQYNQAGGFPDTVAEEFNPDTADGEAWGALIEAWNWNYKNKAGHTFGFFMTVYNSKTDDSQATILSKNMKGLPPQMFLIPDCSPMIKSGYHDNRNFGWEWPTERTSITTLYPEFKDWIQSKLGAKGAQWYMTPRPGVVDGDKLRYSRDPNSPRTVINGTQDDKNGYPGGPHKG